MKKTFDEALADLINEYNDHCDADEMISGMELQIMALKEREPEST